MTTLSSITQPADHLPLLAESCPSPLGEHPLTEPDQAPDRHEAISARERQDQFAQTNRAQIAQIKNHHKWMLRVSCEDVTLDEAACDWIRNHAALWRSDYEAITT